MEVFSSAALTVFGWIAIVKLLFGIADEQEKREKESEAAWTAQS